MNRQSKKVISSPFMGEDKGGGAIILAPHPYLPPRGGKETYGIRALLCSLAMTFCLALVIVGNGVLYSEEIPQRVDGHVVRIDQAKRLLVLGYEHPASGEHIEQEFFVPEDAGFKDFKKLSQLKENDLVSLDYLDYKPTAKAIYVIKIPLEKTYFTHKEVARALLKIKSGEKDPNAAKN